MSVKLSLGLDTQDICFIKQLVEDLDTVDYFKLNPSFLLMDSSRIEDIAFHLNANKRQWIFDAKYGDVYHTNQNLAKYVFEVLNASAVTLNPYSGTQALLPFFYYTSKKCFVLLKTTSNNKNTKSPLEGYCRRNKKVPKCPLHCPCN